MMDFLEARDAWHDFESRCHAARSEQISRIKDDRAFLSGTQWGDDDNELIAGFQEKGVNHAKALLAQVA